MFKLVLEKAEEPEIKLPTSVGSSKKQQEFQAGTKGPHLFPVLVILSFDLFEI